MTTLLVGGAILKAALCPHGCKVYPASSLPMHILEHERLGAGLTASHGWNENRPGKTHVGNRQGRPRKKQSEKAKGVTIRRRGRGGYE